MWLHRVAWKSKLLGCGSWSANQVPSKIGIMWCNTENTGKVGTGLFTSHNDPVKVRYELTHKVFKMYVVRSHRQLQGYISKDLRRHWIPWESIGPENRPNLETMHSYTMQAPVFLSSFQPYHCLECLAVSVRPMVHRVGTTSTHECNLYVPLDYIVVHAYYSMQVACSLYWPIPVRASLSPAGTQSRSRTIHGNVTAAYASALVPRVTGLVHYMTTKEEATRPQCRYFSQGYRTRPYCPSGSFLPGQLSKLFWYRVVFLLRSFISRFHYTQKVLPAKSPAQCFYPYRKACLRLMWYYQPWLQLLWSFALWLEDQQRVPLELMTMLYSSHWRVCSTEQYRNPILMNSSDNVCGHLRLWCLCCRHQHLCTTNSDNV